MVDIIINKYLETQLELAKQKHVLKNSKEVQISDKSKSAAGRISKKQSKSKTLQDPQTKVKKQSGRSIENDSNDDDEYLPSSEDEIEMRLPFIASSSRPKQNVNKIVDDGDVKFYNERVVNWRKSVNEAELKKSNLSYMSADIQYILDGNKDTYEKHVLKDGMCIPNYIWKQLYKYQRSGVKWLWELHQTQCGGLLGDEMGLGKTVQIIAFLSGLANTVSGTWGGLGPSIIVAPATVIFQWVSHFHYWNPSLRVAVLHQAGSHSGNHHKLIRNLYEAHGILLMTYAGIVKYAKDLQSRNWHYLILDEGHKIRNPDTQVSKIVRKFDTPHKLLITGSPMQNSLQELWSLFDFMRPGLLGTHTAFMEHFAIPITQGGYANATDIQEATALEIAKALKAIITPYMLRRTKAEVQDFIHLPDKNEQVLFCALSQEQRDLYMGYLMSGAVRSILDKECKCSEPLRARILVALSTLRKICNHPDIYLYEAFDDTTEIDEESFGHWKRSGKMSVVHSLLKIWQKQGHRTLIFTQSRAMLCILEQHLTKFGFKYLRMDGSVGVGQRQNLIKTFNENSDYLAFLATTRVGGLGVNLTGADRVIIYDPDWNPATDNQAKERAWRIGQQRDVTVYRLLTAGTIEEKIYQRQIFKNFLSNRILVDPNQKNVLTTSTLQGLFTLEDLNCEGDTETASLFKHTKVKINNTKVKKSKKEVFKRKKLEAMKKLAKEISNKISQSVVKKTEITTIDPREAYKKKRNLVLNQPQEEDSPTVNTFDDTEVNVPFENILSELDIVNQHIKRDYEANLLNEASKNCQNENLGACENHDTSERISPEINNVSEQNIVHENNIIAECSSSSKRKQEEFNVEIENLIAVKKFKHKKRKRDIDKNMNDDDYVLTKLFAKAGVQNALQHDVVVGLAEKEKRLRMKEEAVRKAKKAVKALKFST